MTRPDPIPSTSHASASPESTQQYTVAPHLDVVRAGHATLSIDQAGAAVQTLQQMLDRAGVEPKLVRDGCYGPLTRDAVLAFQRAHGLDADGRAGPATLAVLDEALAETPSAPTTVAPELSTALSTQPTVPSAEPALLAGLTTPAATHLQARSPAPTAVVGPAFAPEPGRTTGPFAAARATRQAQAEAILRANGSWPPVDGAIYAITIDQDSPPPSASFTTRANYLRTYTGQMAVFQARGGRLVELNRSGPLRSASHPGQFTARRGSFTDVSGDGSPDIATLRAGVYTYQSHTRHGRFNSTRATLPVARDINHDGVVDTPPEDRNYAAMGIEIHAGATSGPTSVGCQTLPPHDFRQFRQLVRSGKAATFTYVLVRRPNTSQGTGTYRW